MEPISQDHFQHAARHPAGHAPRGRGFGLKLAPFGKGPKFRAQRKALFHIFRDPDALLMPSVSAAAFIKPILKIDLGIIPNLEVVKDNASFWHVSWFPKKPKASFGR